MRTIEEIKGRCFIDEDGHWLWRGAMRGNGVPYIYAPDLVRGGKMSTQCGYRAVYHCTKGVAVPAGHRVFNTCGNPACLNPAHIRCASDAAYGKHVRREGSAKGQVRRILANRAIARARSKVTPEMVADVTTSGDSCVKAAARWGVSAFLIWRVRNGRHKATAAGAGAGGLSTMVSVLTGKAA